MKTLYLECRGCYFWEHDDIGQYSDVGNYRVGSYDYSIHAKNGRDYTLEFGAYDVREIRKNHKITKKPLKHPKMETIKHHALHISAQYEDKGLCWGDIQLMREMHGKLRGYTKNDILKTVNEISAEHYDKIVVISDSKITDRINSIYQKGGYRERAIIDDLSEIKTKQRDNTYLVFGFYDSRGNCFDYEYNSRKITG